MPARETGILRPVDRRLLLQVPISPEQLDCLKRFEYCVLAENLGNRAIYHCGIGQHLELVPTNLEEHREVEIVAKQLMNIEHSSGPAFIICALAPEII